MCCKLICRIGLIGIFFIVTNQLQAQTVEDLGARQSEQLLREQQQRLKYRERERLLKELERSLNAIEIPSEPPKAADPASDTCFTINKIELIGAYNLLTIEKNVLKKPYLNRCLNLNDIDALRTDIDRFYIEKGWIMSRAYLQPNQNIKNGVLIFRVLEGKLGGIELNESSIREKLQLLTAFPDMLNEIISIRDIEQGLDQINRLPSNRATINIEPEKNKPGYSKVLIKNTPENPWRFYTGIDNQGSTSTGKERAKFTADLDNIISLNDNWYFSASEYIGDDGDSRDSSSHSVNVTIPYGYWTYRFSSAHSEYVSTVENALFPFEISGDTDNHSIKITRIAHRGQKTKTTVNTTLTTKDTVTFLEDVRLNTSSRKLTVFDLGVSHVIKTPRSIWSIAGNYSRGLDILDALKDGPESANTIPKAQFEKFSADVSVLLSVADNLSYTGIGSMQLSSDPLFGSEQLVIGDLYSVRGFRDSPVSGEEGIYFKNDITWRAQHPAGLLKNINLSIGLDTGYVRAKNNKIAGSNKAQAVLTGLSLSAQQMVKIARKQQLLWGLTIGQPLSAPDFVGKESTITYFHLNWKWW